MIQVVVVALVVAVVIAIVVAPVIVIIILPPTDRGCMDNATEERSRVDHNGCGVLLQSLSSSLLWVLLLLLSSRLMLMFVVTSAIKPDHTYDGASPERATRRTVRACGPL